MSCRIMKIFSQYSTTALYTWTFTVSFVGIYTKSFYHFEVCNTTVLIFQSYPAVSKHAKKWKELRIIPFFRSNDADC